MKASGEKVNAVGGAGVESAVGQPSRCLARISQVQQRWLTLRRLLAVSLVLAAVLVSGAVVVGIDMVVRGGSLARWLLLAVFVAATVGLTRWLVIGLWSRMPRDRAALLLERSYPELSGRLVTAVQLAAREARVATGASEGLYRQVCAAAERDAAPLDPATVLPGGRYLGRSAAAWGVVLLLVLVALFNYATVSLGAARLLAPWRDLPWPNRTQLEITDPAPGKPVHVVRGGTLALTGRVARQIPRTGTLHVRTASGAADRADFDIKPDGQFTVRYRPVIDDLIVSVEAGDARSRDIEVDMVPPPQVDSVLAECIYPAYTHQLPEQIPDGNVQAVFGSEIRIRVKATKEVREALLAWSDGTPVTMSRTAPNEAEARFNVEASRSYSIQLTDEMGFHNEDPVIYHLEMIDNTYPQIEKMTPAADKWVTPEAVLPIAAEVTDDFGVTEVILNYRVGNAGEAQKVAIPLEQAGKRLTLQYAWSLEELRLEPESIVTYWLEARDAGEHVDKKDWPVSRSRLLHLVNRTELARLLMKQLEELLDGLAQLEALQSECADAVARVAGSIGAGEIGSGQGGAAERARAEKWRQDWLARRAARLAEKLTQIAEDYAISRLDQPARAERLRQTAEELGQIGGTQMPKIVLSLDEALAGLGELASPTTQSQEAP